MDTTTKTKVALRTPRVNSLGKNLNSLQSWVLEIVFPLGVAVHPWHLSSICPSWTSCSSSFACPLWAKVLNFKLILVLIPLFPQFSPCLLLGSGWPGWWIFALMWLLPEALVSLLLLGCYLPLGLVFAHAGGMEFWLAWVWQVSPHILLWLYGWSNTDSGQLDAK